MSIRCVQTLASQGCLESDDFDDTSSSTLMFHMMSPLGTIVAVRVVRVVRVIHLQLSGIVSGERSMPHGCLDGRCRTFCLLTQAMEHALGVDGLGVPQKDAVSLVSKLIFFSSSRPKASFLWPWSCLNPRLSFVCPLDVSARLELAGHLLRKTKVELQKAPAKWHARINQWVWSSTCPLPGSLAEASPCQYTHAL